MRVWETAGDDVLGGGRQDRRGRHDDGRPDRRGRTAAARADHPVARGRGRDALRAQRGGGLRRSGRGPTSYPRRRRARSRASSPWSTCRRSGRIDKPWVGTEATEARRTRRRPPATAPTSRGRRQDRPRARTYLIPRGEAPGPVRPLGDVRRLRARRGGPALPRIASGPGWLAARTGTCPPRSPSPAEAGAARPACDWSSWKLSDRGLRERDRRGSGSGSSGSAGTSPS